MREELRFSGALLFISSDLFLPLKLFSKYYLPSYFYSNCQNIISSIVYLSKSLNCSVIAEYVEDEVQKETLYDLGCEKYQGYLYSKPLPYEDLLNYLQH